jgi:hypothetical protein
MLEHLRGGTEEASYFMMNSLLALGVGLKNDDGILLGSNSDKKLQELARKYKK